MRGWRDAARSLRAASWPLRTTLRNAVFRHVTVHLACSVDDEARPEALPTNSPVSTTAMALILTSPLKTQSARPSAHRASSSAVAPHAAGCGHFSQSRTSAASNDTPEPRAATEIMPRLNGTAAALCGRVLRYSCCEQIAASLMEAFPFGK